VDKVFVLTYDEGAYSDWTMGVLGVFATSAAARDAATAGYHVREYTIDAVTEEQ
jgi:hypothetical protein